MFALLHLTQRIKNKDKTRMEKCQINLKNTNEREKLWN